MGVLTVRKLNHPLFSRRPYYVDTGLGATGMLRSREAGERAISLMKDKRNTRVLELNRKASK